MDLTILKLRKSHLEKPNSCCKKFLKLKICFTPQPDQTDINKANVSNFNSTASFYFTIITGDKEDEHP